MTEAVRDYHNKTIILRGCSRCDHVRPRKLGDDKLITTQHSSSVDTATSRQLKLRSFNLVEDDC